MSTEAVAAEVAQQAVAQQVVAQQVVARLAVRVVIYYKKYITGMALQ